MYLQELTDRLAKGLARQPEEFRRRHVEYLGAAQNEDGGFSGREGGSDLYYTGFALRALAVLGGLSAAIGNRAARFLRHALTTQASIVDFFSLLYACYLLRSTVGNDVLADSPADWQARVMQTLESFRTSDGGYAKSAEGIAGSTYHTFLVGLCYQLLGQSYPEPDKITPFIESRRREDGGFVELAPMKRSGTNPTAAAVGALHLVVTTAQESEASANLEELAGLLEEIAQLLDEVAGFIAGMQNAEGGLQANTRAPVADLLSTFTGLWTLGQLDALDRVDSQAAVGYVQRLEVPTGGFLAGLWDDRADVEYTFYGLGVIGLMKDEG